MAHALGHEQTADDHARGEWLHLSLSFSRQQLLCWCCCQLLGILPHSHFEFCFIIVKYLHNSKPQPTCVRERKILQPFTESVKNRHMYTSYLRRKLGLLFISYIFILLEKCSRSFMVAHGILSFKIYFPSFLPSFLFFLPSSHPSVCGHMLCCSLSVRSTASWSHSLLPRGRGSVQLVIRSGGKCLYHPCWPSFCICTDSWFFSAYSLILINTGVLYKF